MPSTTATLDRSPPPVDKSGERVQRMFGEIAPSYDLMNHVLSMNVDRYWRWWTVRKLAPKGTKPILDVCTGTGDLALAFYHYMQGSAPITASDFTPEMLAIGEQKKQKLGITNQVSFVEADAQNLPFADNSFQVVSVAFGLRNVADTDRGLREMTRVCQPGGKVAVLEFSTPTWEPFKSFYGWYFRNVLPRIGQFFAKNQSSAYEYLPESVGQFPQGKALCQKMYAAGLTETQFIPLTLGIATLYIGVKPCTPS